MLVYEILDRRIAYAQKRQVFWKDYPDLKQVWIGIESELQSLKKELYPNNPPKIF